MNRPTVKMEEIRSKEVPIKMRTWNKSSIKMRQKLKLVDHDKRVKAVNFVLAWLNLSLLKHLYSCHTAITSTNNRN
jgi:hypothetical protein